MPASNSAPAFRPGFPAPHWQAPGAVLYLGDVRTCLRALPSRSVHCVVCSPPYWGLRAYLGEDHPDKMNEIGAEESPDCLGWATGARCGECFVCHMVQVFAGVRRVLRDDGTLWLNLGDTYSGGASNQNGGGLDGKIRGGNAEYGGSRPPYKGLPNGNLIGVPWRTALAMQADGWLLRNDIIWYSPNKMPESVENRCAKSHEHIFLFTKGSGYYFDHVAIQEEAKSEYRSSDFIPDSDKDNADQTRRLPPTGASRNGRSDEVVQGNVNKRDVWVVSTQGYPGAHFAVYSPRLITPCILAGTSEHGACAECGAPYERVVVRTGGSDREKVDGMSLGGDGGYDGHRTRAGLRALCDAGGVVPIKDTVGWRRACGCRTDAVAPCVVLDPFIGSGTTVATALLLGRHGVGIDLSEVYLRENAVPRIDAALRGEAVPRKPTVAVKDGAPPPFRKMRGV